MVLAKAQLTEAIADLCYNYNGLTQLPFLRQSLYVGELTE
jgi:hypothetical protein